jgi:E3 ubiquitin-protein ligase RHA2
MYNPELERENPGLSHEQINMIRLFKYDRNTPNQGSSECCICLDEFKQGQELRELNCKHQYHRQCLESWLERAK